MDVVDVLRSWRRRLKSAYWTRRVLRQAATCGTGLKVHTRSYVSPNTHLGRHVNFNGMRIKGSGPVRIGNYFHSGEECVIITTFHNYATGSMLPYGPKEEDVHLPVTIGDYVWFGDRVTVLGGVSIGDGSIIQAGSVVVSDIPANGIAGGHPARVFKMRDEAHVNDLKARGAFR